MAIKANIVIDQGADFSATIDVVDTDGNPFDLTNYTPASQMRKNYASSTPAATFTCSDSGGTGSITIALSNSITNDIEPGRYLYDVEITSTVDGEVIRVVEGIATVTPGITR